MRPRRLRSSARRSPRRDRLRYRCQGGDRDVAITPDGSRVVYRGNNQLLVRALNQLEPDGADRAWRAAVSSSHLTDSGSGFSTETTIKKVAITGAGRRDVSVCVDGTPRGATWGADGTIVFATNAPATGLQRVSAQEASPPCSRSPIASAGKAITSWPEFLPGGEAVLFTITPASGGIDNAQIAVLDLQTGTSKVLIRGGSHAHYVPTGHLVYGVTGTLRAVAFDLGRLEVVGTPAPVLEGVVTT